MPNTHFYAHELEQVFRWKYPGIECRADDFDLNPRETLNLCLMRLVTERMVKAEDAESLLAEFDFQDYSLQEWANAGNNINRLDDLITEIRIMAGFDKK